MNLSFMLKERAAAGKPVRIGQVGAGKFGTMFLSQVRLTTGMHLVGLADLIPSRAKERLGVQWAPEQIDAKSLGDAIKTGKTLITDNAMSLIEHPEIDVIIEATGDPATGIKLAWRPSTRQAHRDGQRRGRRAGRAAAGEACEGEGGRLQPRLGRSARARLRARRLGARLRVRGHRRRQRHALPPDLSSVDARDRVGHPRHVHEDLRPQPHQSEDVQLVHRRHQVRHRNDRDLQCDRSRAADRTA